MPASPPPALAGRLGTQAAPQLQLGIAARKVSIHLAPVQAIVVQVVEAGVRELAVERSQFGCVWPVNLRVSSPVGQ